MRLGVRSLQVDYDEKSDTLYLYSKKERASGSTMIGNIIIDYGSDGTVTGLEFLNATKTIPPLLIVSSKIAHKNEKQLKEEFLKEINKASVYIDTGPGILIIGFTLMIQKQPVQGKLSILVPSSEEKTRAELLARE